VTTKAIESRVADVRFVLDQLAALGRGDNPDHERRPLPSGLRGALDLGAVGMFGHSDGGATTAHALHTDPRITAGANLDGTLWTPEAVAGSDRPLLLFGRQDLDPYEANTWAAFRKNQRGPKLQLNLTGSTHLTFIGFAVLVPQAAPSSASHRSRSSRWSAPSTDNAPSPSNAPTATPTSARTCATTTAACSPDRHRATPRSGSRPTSRP
jgi:predicted dienelactone hydrolase